VIAYLLCNLLKIFPECFNRGAIAESESPLLPQDPLTQSALAKRLGCSDKAIEKHRKQGSKEQFAIWSGEKVTKVLPSAK
jgi:hypothetical protein